MTISPWLIYLVGIADGLGTVFCILTVVLCGVTGFLFFPAFGGDSDEV